MTSTHESAPSRGASTALALLLSINLFNYIDRQVLASVLSKIQLDGSIFNPTDKNMQLKSGALTTAFMFSYMLLSPLFGRLGDRWSRWTLVGIAVTAWSIASGCSGLAFTYWMLLATRCFVGVGEAAYGPIAPAMISDLFPTSRRGKVMAWFYMAIPVGSALGFVIGGQVEAMTGRWQDAFYVTFAGIFLGMLCFLMTEPPRKVAVNRSTDASYWQVLKSLVKIRSFVLCCLGMTCTTFMLGGVAVFVPAYIFQREARFNLNDEAVTKLAEMKNNADQPLVAPAIIVKLKAIAEDRQRNYTEMRELLQKNLTEEELQQANILIFEIATAKNSITNGQVTFLFGAITVIMGLVATLAGGFVADWLRGRIRGAYFHTAGWSTILAWPFFVGFLYSPFPIGWGLLAISVFLLFFNTGPANTILANVVTSGVRATAFAINILIIHALGDAISPTIIGFIADESSLHLAFLIVSVMIPLGGILWVCGARSLEADTEKANAEG